MFWRRNRRKIDFRPLVLFAAATLCVLGPTPAHAAQDSTVIADNAPIRLEPDTAAQVLEYLPVGSEVRVSSYPLPGGWYRIRAKTGDYGWISDEFLSVRKPKPGKDGAPVEQVARPERDRVWAVRANLGLDFFSPDALNDIFDFNDLDNGLVFGAELNRFIGQKVSVGLRFESLSKGVLAKELTSGNVYNLNLRSYPVMVGADLYFLRLPALRLSLGVYGGLALATSFSSLATNKSEPNEVVLQSNPFTTYARINVTRPMGRVLSVFGELGYRWLKTADLDTSAARNVNGGEVFSRNSVYNPKAIDLSGFVAAVGVGVHF